MRPDLTSFASDNNAGVHPPVLKSLADANALPWSAAYGADPITQKVSETIAKLFSREGEKVDVKLVGSGTAANVLACASFLKPWQSVITPLTSHIHVDECGALERFTGCKVISIPTPDGKLRPELLSGPAAWRGDVHHPQARVVSISQPTELGTLYTVEEIKALAAWAHERDMILHMDGARFANAVVAMGGNPASFTIEANVDALSFGGTKNGLMGAEAVVFFDQTGAARDFEFYRKQAGHLFSKMRFVAAQFEAYLAGNLWLDSARHANAMAERLAAGVRASGKIEIAYPSQTNAVFVRLPKTKADRLLEKYYFYPWQMEDGGQGGIYRWMTSFQTKAEQVDSLLAEAAKA